MESFIETIKCDGHDVMALEKNLSILVNSTSKKPKALIARTIKGKGVSFMEDDNSWHYTQLTKETYEKALSELS